MSLGSFQSRIRLDWLEESALHVFMVLLKNSPSTLKTTDFSLYRKKTNLNLFIYSRLRAASDCFTELL